MSRVTFSQIQTAGLLILAIGSVFWWMKDNWSEPEKQSKSGIPLIRVTNGVSYGYNENGERKLALKSPQVDYHNNELGTIFTRPDLTQTQDTSTNNITALKAVENQQATVITMTGDVIGIHDVSNNPSAHTTFKTPSLVYNIEVGEAETDEPVLIITPSSTTHAIGATWQLNQNLFILKKNIRSYYAPDSDSQSASHH